MLAGGAEATTLARDTFFAAIMILLTGIIGLCHLLGGFRFGEQRFGLFGVSASMVTLTAISVSLGHSRHMGDDVIAGFPHTQRFLCNSSRFSCV